MRCLHYNHLEGPIAVSPYHDGHCYMPAETEHSLYSICWWIEYKLCSGIVKHLNFEFIFNRLFVFLDSTTAYRIQTTLPNVILPSMILYLMLP